MRTGYFCALLAVAATMLPMPASTAGTPYLNFSTVKLQPVGPQRSVTAIQPAASGTTISWPARTPSPIEVAVPAASAAEITAAPAEPVELKLKMADNTPVRQLHLRFRDAGGEIHQFSAVPGPAAADGRRNIRFQVIPGSASSVWSGDGNHRLDPPFRLHSIVLSLYQSEKPGAVELESLEVPPPPSAPQWIAFEPGVRVHPQTVTAQSRPGGARIQWPAGTPSPVSVSPVMRTPEPLEEPPLSPVELQLEPLTDSPVRQIHLRFRDAKGEIFQFSANAAPGRDRIAFTIDPAVASSIWGGDQNRKIDWPLHFHSLLFSLDQSGRPGDVTVKSLQVRPAGRLSVGLNTGDRLNLLLPGGPAAPELIFRNQGDAKTRSFSSVIEIEDAGGMTTRSEIGGTLGPGSEWKYILPGDFKSPGFWYVRVRSVINGKTVEQKFSTARMTPAGPTDRPPRDFIFGVQAHPELYSPDEQKLMARAAALCGIKMVRLAGYWTSIQPTADAWNIDYIDRIVAPYTDNHMLVMLIMGRTPDWAAAKDTVRPYPVTSRILVRPEYDAYENFVRRLAAHFRGRAVYFETWNEPDIHFANFSIDEYLELQRRCYRAVKSVAPEIKVTTGGFAGIYHDQNPGPKQNIIKRTLNEGRDSHDLLAFHGHGSFESYVTSLNYIFDLRSRTPNPAPWFAGETAATAFRIGEIRQAGLLFSKLLYSRANGATAYVWYNLRNKRHPNPVEEGFGLLTRDLQPKPVYVVANTLATWFCDADYVCRLSPTPDLELYMFRTTSGERLLPYWRSGAFSGERLILIRTAGKLSQLDIFGRETPLANGPDGTLAKIGGRPGFLRITGGDGKVPELGEVFRAESAIAIVPGGKTSPEFQVFNPTSRPLELKFEIRCPAGISAAAPDLVRLAPGEKQTLPVTLRADAGFAAAADLICRLTIDGLPPQELRFPVNVATAVEKERPGIPPLFKIGSPEDYYSLMPSGANFKHMEWHGPADLSATVALCRNKFGLRIKVVATDDRHHPEPVESGWNGDSLQFAFQLPGQAGFWEFNAVRSADGTPAIYANSAPTGHSGAAATRQIELNTSRSEEKHETVYELFVPFKAIGLSDRPGSVFQFNLIVNDNDGAGRKGFMRIAPGIGEGKNPVAYPYLRLP